MGLLIGYFESWGLISILVGVLGKAAIEEGEPCYQ